MNLRPLGPQPSALPSYATRRLDNDIILTFEYIHVKHIFICDHVISDVRIMEISFCAAGEAYLEDATPIPRVR